MTSFIVLVLLLTGHLVRGETETNLVIKVERERDLFRIYPALSCTLPRMLDRTVHYCRWIRPDGYGIRNDNHQYTTSSSYSKCKLVILDFRHEKDDGNWTCVVRFKDENGHPKEVQDNIEISKAILAKAYTFRPVTITEIVLTLLILTGIICIAWICYKHLSLCDRKAQFTTKVSLLRSLKRSAVSATQKNLNIDPDSPLMSGSLNESKSIL